MMDVERAVRRRVERVRESMAAKGLRGLLVYFNGQHFMLRMNPLTYLTDFKSLGPSALFLPAEGEASLLVSPEWDLARAREEAVGAQASAASPGGLAAACAQALSRLDGVVGIVGRDTMPVGFAREFDAQVGANKLVDAADLVKALTDTRDELELERIARAAEIADLGFARLCEAAEVGMREYELAAEVEAAMQRAGSDDNYGLMGAGSHNQAIRAPSDRRLEAGDLIVGEITPCWRGCFAQLCRTLRLGEPTPLQREKYDLLIAAEAAGMKAAKPGRPSSDIAEAVNGVFGAAGYAEYCRQPYMRTRGHGLGFGGVVPYDVTESAGPALAENMTMIIHPNQYIPETGYMMLGDTVVIEADGPRSFTQTPRRLFSKAVHA
jgi:Xaa-Pro dipeptidase